MNNDDKDIKDQNEEEAMQYELDEDYNPGDVIASEAYACYHLIPKLFDKVGLTECLKAAFTEEQIYQLVTLALRCVVADGEPISDYEFGYGYNSEYDTENEGLSEMLENLKREQIDKFFQEWNKAYKSKHPLFCSLNPVYAAPADTFGAMLSMFNGYLGEDDFAPLPIGLAYDKQTHMPLWFGIIRHAWRDMDEYHPGDIDDDIKLFEKQGYKAEIVVPEEFTIEHEMGTGRKWYPYYPLNFLKDNGNKYVMELQQLHGLAIDICKKYGDQLKANGTTIRGYRDDLIGLTVKDEENEYGKPLYIHLLCCLDNFENNLKELKSRGKYYTKMIKESNIRPEDDEENNVFCDNDKDFIRDFFIINEKEDGKAEYIFDEGKAKGAAYSLCGYVFISNCEKSINSVLKIMNEIKPLSREYTNIFNHTDYRNLNLNEDKKDAIVFVYALSKIARIILKGQLKEAGLPKYDVGDAMHVILEYFRDTFEDGSYGYPKLEDSQTDMLKKLFYSFGLKEEGDEIL